MPQQIDLAALGKAAGERYESKLAHLDYSQFRCFLPEYMPVPKGNEIDPVFGLGATAWDCLIRPQDCNAGHAPIRSVTVSLRPKYANSRRGKKLIDVRSALEFFDSLANDGERTNP